MGGKERFSGNTRDDLSMFNYKEVFLVAFQPPFVGRQRDSPLILDNKIINS